MLRRQQAVRFVAADVAESPAATTTSVAPTTAATTTMPTPTAVTTNATAAAMRSYVSAVAAYMSQQRAALKQIAASPLAADAARRRAERALRASSCGIIPPLVLCAPENAMPLVPCTADAGLHLLGTDFVWSREANALLTAAQQDRPLPLWLFHGGAMAAVSGKMAAAERSAFWPKPAAPPPVAVPVGVVPLLRCGAPGGSGAAVAGGAQVSTTSFPLVHGVEDVLLAQQPGAVPVAVLRRLRSGALATSAVLERLAADYATVRAALEDGSQLQLMRQARSGAFLIDAFRADAPTASLQRQILARFFYHMPRQHVIMRDSSVNSAKRLFGVPAKHDDGPRTTAQQLDGDGDGCELRNIKRELALSLELLCAAAEATPPPQKQNQQHDNKMVAGPRACVWELLRSKPAGDDDAKVVAVPADYVFAGVRAQLCGDGVAYLRRVRDERVLDAVLETATASRAYLAAGDRDKGTEAAVAAPHVMALTGKELLAGGSLARHLERAFLEHAAGKQWRERRWWCVSSLRKHGRALREGSPVVHLTMQKFGSTGEITLHYVNHADVVKAAA